MSSPYLARVVIPLVFSVSFPRSTWSPLLFCGSETPTLPAVVFASEPFACVEGPGRPESWLVFAATVLLAGVFFVVLGFTCTLAGLKRDKYMVKYRVQLECILECFPCIPRLPVPDILFLARWVSVLALFSTVSCNMGNWTVSVGENTQDPH